MYKNVADQVILFYAYNTSTETAQTGDSANITCQVSIDGGALADLATNTASEIGSGVYSFTTAQADNNGGALAFIASSTTANVSIEPLIVFTLPTELATAVSGLTAPGTSGGLVRGSDTDSLEDVADAVLDELITGHTTADSLGQALTDVRNDTSRVDALIADTGAGDQFTETALELAPSGTSTGATAEEVRIEMDANSTQLSAIVEDTGTSLVSQISAISTLITNLNDFDWDTAETLDGEKLKEAITLMRAVLVGISTDSGTTFRDKDDTLNRVVASVDASYNRDSVTTNVTEV